MTELEDRINTILLCNSQEKDLIKLAKKIAREIEQMESEKKE